jgi:hypothetical protein
LVETPDLYHRPPDSGGLQYKLRGLKKAICSHSEGWWLPHQVIMTSTLGSEARSTLGLEGSPEEQELEKMEEELEGKRVKERAKKAADGKKKKAKKKKKEDEMEDEDEEELEEVRR